mmetsp:Transcript_10911/g.28003  ORF Transcript_10911/g.28003 Transcript_10911/m.28003 type:complete len:318 (+) Transcript_10911:146-1099(+)
MEPAAGRAAWSADAASSSGNTGSVRKSPWALVSAYFRGRAAGDLRPAALSAGKLTAESQGVQGAIFQKAVNTARDAEKLRSTAGLPQSASLRSNTPTASTPEQGQSPEIASADNAAATTSSTEVDDIPERLKYFLDNRKIAFLRRQFHLYDTDGSGTISTSELQVFLKDSLGVIIEENKLLSIIDSVAPKHDGTLTFGAFVMVWYQYCSDKDSKEKIIQMAFEYLDQDGSESISLDNFSSVMTSVGGDPLTEEECKLFYQLLDKGKTQELFEDEFKQFMQYHLDQAEAQDGPLIGGSGADMMMFQTIFKRAVSVLMR